MPFCPKCGAEQRKSGISCLLCGFPVPDIQETAQTSAYPDNPGTANMDRNWLLMRIWRFGSLILLLSGLINVGIDLVYSGQITWSRFPLAALLFTEVSLSLIVSLRRTPAIMLATLFINTTAFLFLLDIFDGKITWFYNMALPLIALSALASLVMQWQYRYHKVRKLLLAANLMIWITAFCVATDFFYSVSHSTKIDRGPLSWSAVVSAVTLPLSMVLFYSHYGLRKLLRFDRFFDV